MTPYQKFGWVLYSIFIVLMIIPVGWALTVKADHLLHAEAWSSFIGFGAAAVFLGLPFIVFAARTLWARRRA